MADHTDLRPASAMLRRLLAVTLVVLFLQASFLMLRELAPILQPLFIAVFLGYLILPAQAWLERRGLPRWLASVVFVLIVVVLLFLLVGMVRRNVEQAVTTLPTYQTRLKALVDRGLAYLPIERHEFEALLQELPIFERDAAANLGRTVQAAGTLVSVVSGAFVVLIYLVFLLAEKANFAERVRRAFGDQSGRQVLVIVDSINQAISEYIAVKTLVSAIAGVASYLVLWLFGVDFAGMWGILVFLFNYIPYLGSLVATALPIGLSFVQFDNPWLGVVVAGLLVGIQQAIGMFIEPRLAGQKLGVSPLLILLSLAFWGLIWGIVGMILAVPLLVATKIILDNIQETKPVAALMSNI